MHHATQQAVTEARDWTKELEELSGGMLAFVHFLHRLSNEQLAAYVGKHLFAEMGEDAFGQLSVDIIPTPIPGRTINRYQVHVQVDVDPSHLSALPPSHSQPASRQETTIQATGRSTQLNGSAAAGDGDKADGSGCKDATKNGVADVAIYNFMPHCEFGFPMNLEKFTKVDAANPEAVSVVRGVIFPLLTITCPPCLLLCACCCYVHV